MVQVTSNQVLLANDCFQGNTNITNVDLKKFQFEYDSMSCTFQNCINLISVTNINKNVSSMYNSFMNCTNLTGISYFPKNATDLVQCFFNCNSLTNVPEIPNSVTTMFSTFDGCKSLVNVPSLPDNLINMSQCFYNCISLTTPPAIPNSVTTMFSSFGSCSNLTSAPSIPNSVTNLAGAFSRCTSINEAPVIPNSVIDMGFAFSNTGLINMPIIPNSVTNLSYAFSYCSNLVNTSTIPESVTILDNTFNRDNKITGNIYILSNQITTATNCFLSTSLRKNVCIPYTYDNGEYTATYNSFINAGYDEAGTNCGVYLKDVNDLTHTLTISPTPSDATVILTAEGYTQEGNSITVREGTNVNYTVSKVNYEAASGTVTVTEDSTVEVSLVECTSYYLRGTFNSWGYSDDYKFTSTDGNTYTLTNVTLAEDDEFKIGTADWRDSYGTSYTITGAGTYTTSSANAVVSIAATWASITLNISARTITMTL